MCMGHGNLGIDVIWGWPISTAANMECKCVSCYSPVVNSEITSNFTEGSSSGLRPSGTTKGVNPLNPQPSYLSWQAADVKGGPGGRRRSLRLPLVLHSEFHLWLRPPWRGPMPHEWIGGVLNPQFMNDGTAIRLQGIRAVQNEQPY